MINLDIEELKKILDFDMPTMYCLRSQYTWTLFSDITEDLKYLKTPVFSVPPQSKGVMYLDVDDSPFYSAGCFGRFTYSRVSRNINENTCLVFSLQMNRKMNLDGVGAINNFCWFTEEQIKEWLDLCKEETGIEFDYRIKKTRDLYTVTYNFRGSSMLQMKTVLFWTRYLYEIPSSLYVLDALILKEKYFQDELVINLLNLVALTNTTNSFRMSDSQCISSHGKFLTREEWIRKLNSENYSLLSEIVTLSSRYYLYTVYGLVKSNSYFLKLEGKEKQVTVTPFITYDMLDKKTTSTGSNRYSFNPVRHWISREDRFERYIPVYGFLKSLQNG